MKLKHIENGQHSVFNQRENRIKIFISYVASFVALTTIYYYFSTLFGLNSDRASILLEAKDIINGNVFLNGWYLSTVPFYFTETLPLAFLSLLFGTKSFLLHLMPALYYSLVVFLSFNLIRKKNKSCAPFIGFILIPSPFFCGLSMTACIHIGAVISFLIIVNLYEKNISLIRKISLSIFGGLATYSDDILLYFLVIPLFISTATLILKKRSITTLTHALLPIGIILVSKLTAFLFDKINSFVMPGTTPPKFATLEQFVFNIKIMVESLLKLFGADILGGSVTDGTTKMALANLTIFTCFFVINIKAIKKRHSFEFIDYVLLFSSIVMPLAFLSSNIPADIGSARYLLPSVISLSIFIGRNSSIEKNLRMILFLSAFILLFINSFNLSKIKSYETSYSVAKYIKEKNLGDGFGNYWRASSVSVIMDNGNTVIVPVNVSTTDNNIYAYKWLSNSKWFALQSRYIILNSDEQLHALTKKFGDDAYIKKIDDTYILIYKDKRLSITE